MRQIEVVPKSLNLPVFNDVNAVVEMFGKER